jgi:hypothetical protein
MKVLPKNNMTATKTLTLVPTWLPGFSGFYNTIWEIDSNIIIIDPPCEDGLSELEWWRFGDARGYSIALAKKCCDVLQGWLSKESGITDFDFEEIHSPLEYNFENDAIYIQVTVDLEAFLPWIKKFIAGTRLRFEIKLASDLTNCASAGKQTLNQAEQKTIRVILAKRCEFRLLQFIGTVSKLLVVHFRQYA